MTSPGGTLIVGLCGGSASGKSALAQHLLQQLGGRAVLLSQDSYYRDCSHLDESARQRRNYDEPAAIDLEAFVADLRRLARGEAITPPRYCFTTHTRAVGGDHLPASPVVLVEGLFVFTSPELRELFDLKVYVHADDDVRLLRRMLRDVEERGRSLASIAEQYLQTVKPMHEAHVAPLRQYADRVVSPPDLAALETTALELADLIAHLARPSPAGS